MNLFELFVKIGVDDKASPAMKNTQKNSETLANKMKSMSAQFESAQKNIDDLTKQYNKSAQKTGETSQKTQELSQKLNSAKESLETTKNKLAVLASQYDTAKKNVADLTKEFNKSAKETGASSKETQELAKKLDDAEKEAEQAKKALDGYNSELGEIETKTKKAGDGLSNFASKLGKGLTTAVTAANTAIIGLGTAAINSYSEFEQLAGGAQKIFDDMDFSRIAADANNAYKELGLSANQYLAVINDVGATFAATMGDEAGYEAAKTGLKAISDYASGTGKNVDELSGKFTLITRSTASYQSIADQFSGILPATSAGFLEQAQAAGILSDSYTQLTEVPIDEYQAAVSQMLQQGVADLGLANNTVLESEITISGSLAAMKAAADNFLVALVDDNADVGESFSVLATSVGTFLDNVIPKIWDFIGALGPVGPLLVGITAALGAFHAAVSISKVVGAAVAAFEAYRKANEGATIAQWLMNAAMNANPFVLVATLVAGLVAAIITLWNTNEGFREAVSNIWGEIQDLFSVAWEFIKNIWAEVLPYFEAIWEGIRSTFSVVTEILGGFFSAAWSAIKSVWSVVSSYFSTVWNTIKGIFSVVESVLSGNFSDAWESIKGIFDGWAEFFEGLWDDLTGVFSDAWGWFSEIGGEIVDGIKSGISAAWEGLKEWFNGIWDSLFGNREVDVTVNGNTENENNASQNTDGSHFSGLDYVPFDGYIAELHKGERVLTAKEAKAYNGGISYGDIIINVNGARYDNERSLANEIAETLRDKILRKERVYA